MASFNRSLAVVIGINEYSHGIPRLQTAVADATRVAQVLGDSHGYTVRLLTEDVTHARLRGLLGETLAKEVGPDDRLFLYFAGHGIALNGDDGPRGYLVPQDAHRDDPGTFLPMTELHAALAMLPCRHLLLVLDCCFAGAFRWSSTRDLSPLPSVIHKERYDRYLRDPAWQVLTSAAFDQKALDVLAGETIGERGAGSQHSPFAEALFRGLAGEADLIPRGRDGRPSGDGVITATELYLYLRECVEVAAADQRFRQTPGLWPLERHDKGEYILLVPGHELNLPLAPELNYSNNPYRGLQSYEEEHGGLFFGRRELVETLHAKVAVQPLTVVLGASGTGKSSAVKAGLLPHLRRVAGERWQIAPPLRPGKSPLASLMALTLPGEEVVGTTSQTLAQRVETWGKRQPDGRLLLVVDQFEELITLCLDAGESDRFIEQLASALEMHPERFRVVLTLRSDFEPQFAACPLKARWMASRLVVPPMSQDELREVIEGPASVRVLYFKPYELVDRLINDVVQTPGALPLLSFTLRELYIKYLQRRGEDRALTLEDYDALGGVGGSLRNRATEEYDRLPDDAHRATMQRVMLRMVSLEGGELARRRVPRRELDYPDPAENERVERILMQLLDVRLLVTGSEPAGQPYVEPAHDALIRGWDKLLRWSREGQEDVLLRQLLAPAADDWNHHKGGLWHGNPRLSLLAGTLESGDTWLNRTEMAFVRHSIRRRRNIFLGAGAFLSAAFLTLLSLTVYAFSERDRADENAKAADNRARIAESRRLALFARNQLNENRIDSALLLASMSYRSAPTFEARDIVLTSIITNPNLMTFLRERKCEFNAVAFSPDGKTLASGCADKTIVLWNVADRRLLEPPLQGHTDAVTSVAFNPHGNTMASGSWDGTVILWDVTNRCRSRFTLKGHKREVTSVAFSPDGKTLASGSYDRTVILWDIASGLPKEGSPLSGHNGDVLSVAFSPDGTTLASGGSDQTVVLWDVASGRPQSGSPLKGHFGPVTSVAFSSDGKSLASGSVDKTVVLWGVGNRQPKKESPFQGHKGPILSVSFSPDGCTLASASDDQAVILWDAGNGRPKEGSPLKGHLGDVSSVAFSPDGQTLASASDDETVILWDLAGRRLRVGTPLEAHQGFVLSVAFSPDGTTLASGGADQTVVLWDVASGRPQSGSPLKGHSGPVTSVAFSPDGKTLASGSYDRTVILWDIASGLPKEGSPLSGHNGDVLSVAFSPDGTTLASGGADQTVVLWDVANGRPRPGSPLKPKQGPVQKLISSLAFSPNGRILAAGTWDQTLILWDVSSGLPREGESIKGHRGPVASVTFSPDGKTLISGSRDGSIIFWDLTSDRPREQQLIERHNGPVSSIALSSDGKTLMSGDGDGVMILWDVASRRQLGVPLRGHKKDIRSIAFRHDDKILASGSLDGTVIIWDVDPASWESQAVRIANRLLTDEEFRQFQITDVSTRLTTSVRPLLRQNNSTSSEDPGRLSISPFWSLLTLWVVYWLWLVPWPRLRPHLKEGGWVSLALLCIFGSTVWGCCSGPLWQIGGSMLPSVLEKFAVTAALVGLAFVCGSLQEYFGWTPLDVDFNRDPTRGRFLG